MWREGSVSNYSSLVYSLQHERKMVFAKLQTQNMCKGTPNAVSELFDQPNAVVATACGEKAGKAVQHFTRALSRARQELPAGSTPGHNLRLKLRTVERRETGGGGGGGSWSGRKCHTPTPTPIAGPPTTTVTRGVSVLSSYHES
jgi:hypothetical protein